MIAKGSKVHRAHAWYDKEQTKPAMFTEEIYTVEEVYDTSDGQEFDISYDGSSSAIFTGVPLSDLKLVVEAKQNMTEQEIIQAISDNFLCVRRLPFIVVSYWSYREGGESKLGGFDGRPIHLEGGKILNATREIVVQHRDLEYFQKEFQKEKEKPSKWNNSITPEKRFANWNKNFPNGRKLIKETRIVEQGGWWYVKPCANTDSTVRFSREFDRYFAPTLGEAIELYLTRNNIQVSFNPDKSNE